MPSEWTLWNDIEVRPNELRLKKKVKLNYSLRNFIVEYLHVKLRSESVCKTKPFYLYFCFSVRWLAIRITWHTQCVISRTKKWVRWLGFAHWLTLKFSVCCIYWLPIMIQFKIWTNKCLPVPYYNIRYPYCTAVQHNPFGPVVFCDVPCKSGIKPSLKKKRLPIDNHKREIYEYVSKWARHVLRSLRT